jgi:hypothetical protein
MTVAIKKLPGIIFQQVNLGANFFGFTRREAIYASIAMQTDKDSFKQLLRRGGRGSQKLVTVPRKATDKTINWLTLSFEFIFQPHHAPVHGGLCHEHQSTPLLCAAIVFSTASHRGIRLQSNSA